jgi:hypothetical protein
VGTNGAYGGGKSTEWKDFPDAWSSLGNSGATGGLNEGPQPEPTLFDPSEPTEQSSDVDRTGRSLINALLSPWTLRGRGL